MTEALTPPPEPAEPAADPRADTLEALEGALDALREHHPQRVPQWEYCEGVLTALLCMRRTVPPTEWVAAGGGVLFTQLTCTLVTLLATTASLPCETVQVCPMGCWPMVTA